MSSRRNAVLKSIDPAYGYRRAMRKKTKKIQSGDVRREALEARLAMEMGARSVQIFGSDRNPIPCTRLQQVCTQLVSTMDKHVSKDLLLKRRWRVPAACMACQAASGALCDLPMILMRMTGKSLACSFGTRRWCCAGC